MLNLISKMICFLINTEVISYFALKYAINSQSTRFIMKKNPFLLTFFIALFISSGLKAENPDTTAFKPNGSPILKIFFNYHSGIFGEENLSQFEATRAYLGYQYNLTKELNIYIKLD